MASLLPRSVSNLLAKRKEARTLRLFEENLSDSGKAVFSLLGRKPTDFIRKEDRSVIAERVTRYTDLIEPAYDPNQLQDLYEMQWVVRMCVDKLVRESTRHGWGFVPDYEVKCDTCETEYDFMPLSGVCPTCAKSDTSVVTQGTTVGHLSKPDPSEIEHAQEFLSHPNPVLTCDDLLKRAVKDLLIFDDFYESIVLRKDIEGDYWQRMELWPEDARMMQIQADEKGRLGGKVFCQVCEARKNPGTTTLLYPPEDAAKNCPTCEEGKLVPMAYAQVKGAQPVTAWSKEEIVHGNLWAIGSRLFGTPKLWAIQTQVTAMGLIDRFQKDSFDKAKTPKNIFVVKGIDKASLSAMLRAQEQAKELNPMADFWLPIPASPQGGAQFGIDKIPGIDTPLIQGSLPYQEFYMKAICYTFGVSPSAIGVETAGRLGTGQAGTEQKDVTPETINEIQKQTGETFGQFLKRFFPEIQSWHFALETAHEKELLDEWNVKKLQMETAKIAVDAGFDVAIDEDGQPKISGEGKQPEPPTSFGQGGSPFGGGHPQSTSATSVVTRDTESTSITKAHFHKAGDACQWVTINGQHICIGGDGGKVSGTLRVYHGTSVNAAEKIRREGLRRPKRGDVYGGTRRREPSVYFSTSEATARKYGQDHASRFGHTYRSQYAIVEFRIPKGTRVIRDEASGLGYGKRSEFRMEQDVPPGWITNVETVTFGG